MKVTIHLLGQARQLAGRESVDAEIPAGGCTHDALPAVLRGAESRLVALLADENGRLRRSVMPIRNDKVIDPGEELHANDEVSLLPPMSGG